jgi:copper(I)-binding protein
MNGHGAWILALALSLPGVGTAKADVSEELGSDIRIEAVAATAGPKGGMSRLRFRIVNDGLAGLHLLGIRTEVAEKAELIAKIGANAAVVMQSISIPSEETLDLTTSHLVYQLYPLHRSLTLDDEFSITLDFVRWSVTVPVRVQRAPEEGPADEDGGVAVGQPVAPSPSPRG